MGASDVVLSVAGLTKSFGGLQAVRGVDFQVERGAIVGLIGAMTARCRLLLHPPAQPVQKLVFLGFTGDDCDGARGEVVGFYRWRLRGADDNALGGCSTLFRPC